MLNRVVIITCSTPSHWRPEHLHLRQEGRGGTSCARPEYLLSCLDASISKQLFPELLNRVPLPFQGEKWSAGGAW